MSFRVYSTEPDSEPFSGNRVFEGNRSFADIINDHAGVRAPTQEEFKTFFDTLDKAYRDGLFGDSYFAMA
jgi:hypothetical protein